MSVSGKSLMNNGQVKVRIDMSSYAILLHDQAWQSFKKYLLTLDINGVLAYFYADSVTSFYYVPDVPCSEFYGSFGNLSLDFSTHRLTVPPSSYLKDFKLNYYGEAQPMCRVLL
jgi:hypothetical protein